MKVLENLVGLYRTVNFSFFSISGWGMFAKSLQLCPTLFNPTDCNPLIPLSMRFPRQEYWSGLLCLPPGDVPDPGIKSISLKSPALAGRFITTSGSLGPMECLSGNQESLFVRVTLGILFSTEI